MNRGFLAVAVLSLIPLQVLAVGVDALSDLPEVEIPEREGFSGLVGLGAASVPEYRGSDERTGAVFPLLSLRYGNRAYFSFNRAGVWLTPSDQRRLRFGLQLSTRRGYDPDDVDALEGMDARDTSLEGGVNFIWRTGIGKLSGSYATDLNGTSEGQSAKLAYSLPIYFDFPSTVVSANIGAEWLSADTTDYFYGVTDAEATTARPAYQAEATINTHIGVNSVFRITDSWLGLAGITYQRLGDEAADSPIIDERGSTVVFAGAAWRF